MCFKRSIALFVAILRYSNSWSMRLFTAPLLKQARTHHQSIIPNNKHGFLAPSTVVGCHSRFAFSPRKNLHLQSTRLYSTTQPPNLSSITLAKDTDFIKSQLDRRQYKCIKLPNQLQILLVSDPQTDIEAAAMHIKAGHFNDPPHRAGLAHFHEHMVFLGTRAFPKENDFEAFLAKNGGSSNAFTDMEDTNYYFHVAPLNHDLEPDEEEFLDLTDGEEDDLGLEEQDEEREEDQEVEDDLHHEQSIAHHWGSERPYAVESVESLDESKGISSALSGSLERFSQFFIAPLFNPDCVERELRAIDSEYVNGLTEDSWRHYQLLKASAHPDHPFVKFGCGNYFTLTNGGNLTIGTRGSSPRDELIQFWERFYVAENMRLCVVGRCTLDVLQEGVEQYFKGVRSDESFLKSIYGVKAFDRERLGIWRETIPLVEMRSIKILFAAPSMDTELMNKYKPFNVISHLLGHESPGSLHAILLEEGLINELSSAVGIETSDFSLCTLNIALTEKGMVNVEYVLDMIWKWINLIKKTVKANPELMSKYHSELRQIASNDFKFRENGDPTEFCSRAAEMLFKYDPSHLLIGSAEPLLYNATLTETFVDLFEPENCIVQICSSDFSTNKGLEWEIEPLYRCQYRQKKIPAPHIEKWKRYDFDTRFNLPGLNSFIPDDFSLRCEDDDSIATADSTVDYTKTFPSVILKNPSARLWHKMDRSYKVPKTAIRIHLTSPSVYKSPRSMTLARIFQKMLSDDLNSYVYDATIAGSYYRVLCTPFGFSIALTGFSEKLLHLLEVVLSRIFSLLEDMKGQVSVELERKFDKAKQSLLIETRNLRLESPYELANYNTRMLIENNVWHISNYLNEMEGEYAARIPLCIKECASVVEECFTSRLFADILCMGNINERESYKVNDIVNRHFLMRCRPLSSEEITKIVSLQIPTKLEAMKIFGGEMCTDFLVYEDKANNSDEENNSVELFMQIGSEHMLGYKGVAMVELIGHMAYNSAYDQLRTKEQLGYIVSASPRKFSGGSIGLSIVVQSSTYLPAYLEERCLNWLGVFREELNVMTNDRIIMEATAVVAQLTERNIRFRDEVSFAWGEILSTEGGGNMPAFNRLDRLADELRSSQSVDFSRGNSSTKDLKIEVLSLFDQYLAPNAAERRAVCTRIYGSKGKEVYESNRGKSGYISSYDGVRKLKSYLSTLPSAQYWESFQD